MDKDLAITTHVSVPRSELSFRFARSGGHGGQNVNKVETKVELLFDVLHSPSLTDEQKERILKKLENRIDSEGVLRIVSQESRSQSKNREAAVERFIELMSHALKVRKKRMKTKIPKAVKERRLETKKRRGEVKRLRRIKEV
ncbi:MAG: aminoacyl-tRNA hydrolase [Bacteroidetes bacterium]|nr:MAG: aminoacyl-tRNA hydrolase [Bacteroidota bacterium]